MIPTKPETITREEYEAIEASGQVGPKKRGYPAIIILPDNSIAKLWVRKPKFFSSSRWTPHPIRFIRNATKLRSHGIVVPEILSYQKIENSHIQLITYTSLPGHSIRDLLTTDPSKVDIPAFANFVYQLHEKGIIFRAIHLGNVIVLPDGDFGLIDFTGVTFLKKPVPPLRRAANIATPLRYRDDVKLIKKAKLPGIPESYIAILKQKQKPLDEQKFLNTVETHSKD